MTLDPTRRRIIERVLVTPEGAVTAAFAREWIEAHARTGLDPGAVIVTPEGKPNAFYLARWFHAWGGEPLRSINPEMILFGPDGRFTPMGYARWLAAVKP